ncbi:MAG: DJ-1/PfpI family protein, partial [Polyangia bacterium]
YLSVSRQENRVECQRPHRCSAEALEPLSHLHAELAERVLPTTRPPLLLAMPPVAAICHGPWTVIETGYARGRRVASWPSLKTDLRNAGAEWMDQQVVVDGNLVSSRKPDDIPAFNRGMIELFKSGAQAQPEQQPSA